MQRMPTLPLAQDPEPKAAWHAREGDGCDATKGAEQSEGHPTAIAVAQRRIGERVNQESQRLLPAFPIRFNNRTAARDWGTATAGAQLALNAILYAAGCFQGARYGRARSLLASSSPTIWPLTGSQARLRPSFMDMFARMQLALEM